MPAISAPPAVDKVSGTPLILKMSAPISAPITIETLDERHIGDVGRTIHNTQQFGDGADVLRAPDESENVAPLNLRVGQDGDRWRRSRPA